MTDALLTTADNSLPQGM